MQTPPAAPLPSLHAAHWPPGLPRHLTLPQTNVWYNAEVSAARYPDKPFIIFYDTAVTFAEFKDATQRIAGYLQTDCGIRAGDRVVLYMQNSPQWILAFYGILRANAVVVPINPMNRREELRHCVDNSGARAAFVAQELLAHALPLLRKERAGDEGRGKSGPVAGLARIVVAAYSDYLRVPTDLPVPAFVSAPALAVEDADAAAGVRSWQAMMSAARVPGPLTAGPDDLCVMPYTSGTTGAPKGCMHTHRSVMSTLVGGAQWSGRNQDAVYLTVLPLFHVTGMSGSMNGPLYLGATIVLLPRWNADAAAQLMQRHRVTIWQLITTMMIDFVANPRLPEYDISSLQAVRGGGAAMPAAIAEKLRRLTGLEYLEGYGMTETMAATHLNPPHRPKAQCLGIPVFDVDAKVIDPGTLGEVPLGDTGEIIVHGPQVMKGYWEDAQADAQAFLNVDGRRFLRTGDLGRIDEDGYFFMVDRLKRMINASGFKVWPAEVEAMMYDHPDIQEVCVIGARDTRRGETVKAMVVLAPARKGRLSEADVIAWAHARMAPYKCPRIIEFVETLPKSGTGKVLWRTLQEQENARAS